MGAYPTNQTIAYSFGYYLNEADHDAGIKRSPKDLRLIAEAFQDAICPTCQTNVMRDQAEDGYAASRTNREIVECAFHLIEDLIL